MDNYQEKTKQEQSLEDKFLYSMKVNGYFLIENVIDAKLLAELRSAIDLSFDQDEKALNSGKYKSNANVSDVSRLLLGRHSAFEELIEKSSAQAFIDLILSDTCIINNYSAVRLMPNKKNVVGNIHKDSPRHSPEYKLAIQLLYFVDDFTEETGGTWILPGSHNSPDQPSEEMFFSNGKQIVGKAGTVMIFDSSLWHAGGFNISTNPRRGIAIVYTRSFIKQQIDIVKALPSEMIGKFSEKLKRLVGYNVRVPSSIEEFYLPTEQRLYKGGQG
ncbi:hypothetical protein CNR22_07065 [Sphingobacteriaceae bacterium]|nr:hypothetical protein CNR22_07065 [Sphingobacteriaceae bacterium]